MAGELMERVDELEAIVARLEKVAHRLENVVMPGWYTSRDVGSLKTWPPVFVGDEITAVPVAEAVVEVEEDEEEQG